MTAATMVDPVWKKRSIIAVIALGVVWVSLSIATDDKAAAAVLAAFGIGAALLKGVGQMLVTTPGIIALTFAVTVAAVILVQRIPWQQLAVSGPDSRVWLSGFHICGWAGKELVDRNNAVFERHETCERAWRQAAAEERAMAATYGSLMILQDQKPQDYAEASAKAVRAQEEYSRVADELQNAEAELRGELYRRLVEGTLVAKGFLPPFNYQSVDVDIPSAQWRFLRFDKDMQNAEGQGVVYVGVRVTDPKHKSKR